MQLKMTWCPYITLTIGEPAKFQITVQPAEDYPVDLYYLMDMSLSMEDDLDNLRDLAGKIGGNNSILYSCEKPRWHMTMGILSFYINYFKYFFLFALMFPLCEVRWPDGYQ